MADLEQSDLRPLPQDDDRQYFVHPNGQVFSVPSQHADIVKGAMPEAKPIQMAQNNYPPNLAESKLAKNDVMPGDVDLNKRIFRQLNTSPAEDWRGEDSSSQPIPLSRVAWNKLTSEQFKSKYGYDRFNPRTATADSAKQALTSLQKREADLQKEIDYFSKHAQLTDRSMGSNVAAQEPAPGYLTRQMQELKEQEAPIHQFLMGPQGKVVPPGTPGAVKIVVPPEKHTEYEPEVGLAAPRIISESEMPKEVVNVSAPMPTLATQQSRPAVAQSGQPLPSPRSMAGETEPIAKTAPQEERPPVRVASPVERQPQMVGEEPTPAPVRAPSKFEVPEAPAISAPLTQEQAPLAERTQPREDAVQPDMIMGPLAAAIPPVDVQQAERERKKKQFGRGKAK